MTDEELARARVFAERERGAMPMFVGCLDKMLATIDARDREVALLQQMCAANGGVADRAMSRADDGAIALNEALATIDALKAEVVGLRDEVENPTCALCECGLGYKHRWVCLSCSQKNAAKHEPWCESIATECNCGGVE